MRSSRVEIGVENELLEMLQQRAARAVDHALRQPGRARRVHDVERDDRTADARIRSAPRCAGRSEVATRSLAARESCDRCRRLRSGTARRRRARSPESARRSRECARDSRSRARRSGSRRRRRARAAGSVRSDRARRSHRSPASTTTRSRRGSSSASIAMTVSGIFGRNPATRSPASIPIARSAAATRATSRYSSR